MSLVTLRGVNFNGSNLIKVNFNILPKEVSRFNGETGRINFRGDLERQPLMNFGQVCPAPR